MSDYEDDYMCGDGDGDEEYDLEYSEDSNSEPDVDLENQYYNSKALKDQSPEEALKSFQKVLDLEDGEKGNMNRRIERNEFPALYVCTAFSQS